MKYTEKWSLRTLDQPDALLNALLVSEEPALSCDFVRGVPDDGQITLFPAWQGSKRVWLKRLTVNTLINEYIVSFERGIEILAENGVFNFPEPKPAWTVQETILLEVDDEYDREDIAGFLGVEYWLDGVGYTDGPAYFIEFKDVLEEKHHDDMDRVSLGCRLDGYSYEKHSKALYALKCDWCGWGVKAYALIKATPEAVREALKA